MVLEPAGAAVLLLEEGFVNLSAGEKQALWVDVEQFEAAAARAKSCQDAGLYQDALGFYSGSLLPDDLYEEWTIQRRVKPQADPPEPLTGPGQTAGNPSGIPARHRDAFVPADGR